MADRSTNPESAGGPASDRVSSAAKPPKAPRWVKALAIIGIVLALLIVIALATGLGGPGDHGPGRHLPSGNPDGRGPLTSAAAGHAQLGDAPIGRTLLAGLAGGPAGLADVPHTHPALA